VKLRLAAAAVLAAVACFAASLNVAASPVAHTRAATCPGKERWAIKTLTDADAGTVNYSHPVTATVAELAAQAPDRKIRRSTPRLGSEKTVYRVTARLVKAKSETGSDGDEDIHLVIGDLQTDDTMIAEFPKPGCDPQAQSAKAPRMVKARAAFVAACGTPSGSPATLKGTVTLTGVGFWDLKHGTPQLGRAPHDRELHPVLSFKIKTPCS